ncbi:hypothetical protein [Dyella subtropica]|uniref:hypothetical protein n=1 Tax=Dyella subtropica TaxID=2992127 RepID=UPI002252F82F|nr:hypothetical protein [Dyella subtropica]
MSSNTINASDSSQFVNTMIGNSAASAGRSASADQSHSWFEAMAKAWGSALDQQANKVTTLSDQVSSSGTNGPSDSPSVLTQLTAESLKMQFLSTSASTSTNAIGQALNSLGQK